MVATSSSGPITGFDDVLESILNVTEHLSQP